MRKRPARQKTDAPRSEGPTPVALQQGWALVQQITDIEGQLQALVKSGPPCGRGVGGSRAPLPAIFAALQHHPEQRVAALRLLRQWLRLTARLDEWVRVEGKRERAALRREIRTLVAADTKARAVAVRRRLKQVEAYMTRYGLTVQDAFYRVFLDAVAAFEDRATNPRGLTWARMVESVVEARRRLKTRPKG